MGFGILFIGYLLTYLLSLAGQYGCYPAIVGCFVMFYALTKLVEYEPKFRYAFFAVIPITLCVAYTVSAEIATMLGASLPGFLGAKETAIALGYANAVSDLVFHVFLLSAIAKIAEDTGVLKVKKAAYRNLEIYCVFFVFQIASDVIKSESAAAMYVFAAAMLLWLVWLVLDSVVIFSCYMNICDDTDSDMEMKPSPFKFVNRIRAEFDAREERAQRANREYRENKMKKRVERLNNAKNKKKNRK